MFESLRYRWDRKDVRGIALIALFFVAFGSFELWRVLASGGPVNGVIVSTGAVSRSKLCGGTRQLALVQLADGRAIYASVDYPRPLLPGTEVTIQKEWFACSGGYDVIAVR